MGESDINARSSIIIFFILAVGFSLTYAGIFRDNTAIGIVAYAKKSESSGGSSDSGEGSSSDSSGSSSAVSSSTGSDNNPPKGEPSLKPENPQSSPPAPPKEEASPTPTEEATPTPTPTPCSQAALAMPCPPPPPPPPDQTGVVYSIQSKINANLTRTVIVQTAFSLMMTNTVFRISYVLKVLNTILKMKLAHAIQ